MTPSSEFTVGAVVRRTIDVLGGGMPTFLGIALVFDLLPQALSALATSLLIPTLASGSAGAGSGAPIGWPIASGLLVFVAAAMGKGAVVEAALAACERRPWSFASAVAVGIRACPSNLGILFLDYLGVGVASILLVFPGLMLLCRWVAAVPANVAERPGVMGALGRSRDLTDGYRWRIFGLLLIFGAFSAAIPILALLSGVRHHVQAGLSASVLVDTLSSVVFSLIGSVGIAAIYVELRAAKGGALPPDLVSAFE